MKNLKFKLAVGVLSVGIIASIGTALAKTDAGQQFTNWYKAQFNASADRVDKGLSDHSYDKENDWIDSNFDLTAQSVQDIADKGTDVTDNAKSAINRAKEDYLAAINAAKARISAKIAGDYDIEIAAQNGVTDDFVDDAGGIYLRDMQNELSTQGNVSMSSLNSSVSGTKAAAISALQAAIDKAKSELQALMNAEESAAITETTTYLDNALEAKKATVDRLVTELEETIKGNLKNAADSLQASAESELDAIVNGMNAEPAAGQ